jgi:hypothetical protein
MPGGENIPAGISPEQDACVEDLVQAHDYEAIWDYSVIEDDPDENIQEAIQIADAVKAEILPELRRRFGISDQVRGKPRRSGLGRIAQLCREISVPI